MHNKVRAKRTCTVLNCASTQYLQQFVFVRTTLSASHRWFWGFFVAIFGCANYSASWLRITAKAVNSDAIKMTNRSTNPHDDYVCCTRDENVMCLLIVLSTLLFCFFFFQSREFHVAMKNEFMSIPVWEDANLFEYFAIDVELHSFALRLLFTQRPFRHQTHACRVHIL